MKVMNVFCGSSDKEGKKDESFDELDQKICRYTDKH
jgi:hypothetical protein